MKAYYESLCGVLEFCMDILIFRIPKLIHNPLTPRAFCQKCIWTLQIFSLDVSQISSNTLGKAFATWQHPFLSIAPHFTTVLFRQFLFLCIWTRKWPTSFSVFSIFFCLPFFSFSFCGSDWPASWACFWLKSFQRNIDSQFLPWSSQVSAGIFSLKFFSLFVHILVSIEPITYLGIIGKIFSSCRTQV